MDLCAKPPCHRDDATAVLRRIRDAGHVAYFAGGCVRDLLLNLHPADWDIATDAPPKRIRQLFPNTQAVGQAFGVILVRYGASVVEVATFRSEGKYLDGRRPSSVQFTTAQQDAQRRDFTINGLFLDPLDNDRIIDYVGGVDDLHARRLRAIGQPHERFREDHLRLLRALRFAARFDLAIDPATAAAIQHDAPLLKHISPERIADELRRMLTPPTRSFAWQLLWQFGLIKVIFRFLPGEAPAGFDAARCIFLATTPEQPIAFGLALAAGTLGYRWQAMPAGADLRPLLARNSVQQLVKAMRQGLKISNDESDLMQSVLESIAPLLPDEPPRVAVMKRFLALPASPNARRLLQALAAVGLYVQRVAWLTEQLAELEKTDVAPPPLVTGDDLTAAGLTPGPAFKRILDTVYDAQLENTVTDRDAALELAMKIHRSA